MRLFLGGLAALLAGLGAIAFGLLYLALPALAPSLAAGGIPAPDLRVTLAGGITYLLAGAALGWTGLGAMLGRRWAGPVLTSLAWIWLVAGALGSLLVALVLPGLAGAAPYGLDVPPETWLLALALGFGLAVGCGVVVPAFVLLALRVPGARAPGVAADPVRAWSERCPQPVLALALALGATSLLALPTLLRPVVPVFHVVLTGPAASLVTLAGAGLSGWLAWSVYRLERRGLLGTMWVSAACGVSLIGTILTVDAAELAFAIGIPPADAEWLTSAAPIGRPAAAALAAVATLGSLAWLGSVRRHFPRRTG